MLTIIIAGLRMGGGAGVVVVTTGTLDGWKLRDPGRGWKFHDPGRSWKRSDPGHTWKLKDPRP